MADLGGVCAYGPKGCTEGWQPIDSGHIGATFKALAKSKFEAWVEKTYEPGKQNWEKWEANKVTMRQKHILCTFVFGEAWAELCSDKYAWIRHAAFVRAGLLCTLHGKNDECVYIEGRKDTQVVKDLGSARNHQNPNRFFQYIVLLKKVCKTGIFLPWAPKWSFEAVYVIISNMSWAMLRMLQTV